MIRRKTKTTKPTRTLCLCVSRVLTGDGVGEEATGDGVGEEATGDGVGKKVTGDGVGEEVTGDDVGEEVTGDGVWEEVTGDGVGKEGAEEGEGDEMGPQLPGMLCAVPAWQTLQRVRPLASAKVRFGQGLHCVLLW